MTTVTAAFFCVHGIIAKSITIHIFFKIMPSFSLTNYE